MRSTPRRARALAGIAVLLTAQAMATMDGSILAVAAPSLSSSLHLSGAQLQLVPATYTIAFAILVVTGARLGDILGRRRVFVHGLRAFTLTSLAGGLAPTAELLIVARTFQGAAAALMTAQILSIIQTQVDGEQRARAIGANSMILAVGVAVGQRSRRGRPSGGGPRCRPHTPELRSRIWVAGLDVALPCRRCACDLRIRCG